MEAHNMIIAVNIDLLRSTLELPRSIHRCTVLLSSISQAWPTRYPSHAISCPMSGVQYLIAP